ncbi:alanine racemase [Demequina sp. B12]|uniref:alanine racemase n=1 Tax=Demequina sp. B12 TaxID=2992757 RepID=UPI00237BEB3D|nr:alanine racemase [Demequina sp. B12]MDE0571845.1 alanine racemase [Demequina sp. B12]
MTLADRARVLGDDKSLPAWAVGLNVEDVLTRLPRVNEFWTPLLLVDRQRLTHNIGFLATWAIERGLEHMPHGKTSMSPELWREQIDAGASGITVATPWQARIAVESGISTVMLANQVADPHTAQWLAGHQGESTQVMSWVDSPTSVELLGAAGVAASGEVPVLVELGRPGGRTGTRTMADARSLIRLVHDTPGVKLAGIAGYEGAITHGRGADALATVRTYVTDLVDLAIEARVGNEALIVTAGGSAYPDAVADALEPAVAAGMRGVVRCGAYVLHDEGHYLDVSPFDHTRWQGGLVPAARALARVVSAPEPGLVLLDAGKRDLPYDEGLPVPVAAFSTQGARGDGGGELPLPDAHVDAMNDQHTFVRTGSADLTVGDVVVLGLSHPCTMADKWRLIPVVDSFDAGLEATVVDFIETRF